MPSTAPRSRRIALLAALVTTVLAAPAHAEGAGCQGADDQPHAGAFARASAATVCLVNAERRSQGLRPLHVDAHLRRAATRHARTMVAHRFFAHEGPDGSHPLDRMRAAGLRLPARFTVGEDLAWGEGSRSTPRETVAAWMASPGHRAIILTARFTRVGVGLAAGTPSAGAGATYAADFATRPHR